MRVNSGRGVSLTNLIRIFHDGRGVSLSFFIVYNAVVCQFSMLELLALVIKRALHRASPHTHMGGMVPCFPDACGMYCMLDNLWGPVSDPSN